MPRILKSVASVLILLGSASALMAQSNPLAEFTVPFTNMSDTPALAAAGYSVYLCAAEQTSGTVYVYASNAASGGTGFSQIALITSPTNSPGPFGTVVAAEESTLVVGAAINQPQSSGGNQVGAVYVYARDGNTLNLLQTIHSPSSSQDDGFGSHIAISGSWMVIAAVTPSTNGSVYLYHDAGQGFELVQTITDSGGDSKNFGSSLAILGPTLPGSSASGVVIAVGEPNFLNQVTPAAGKVFVYQATISGSGVNLQTNPSLAAPAPVSNDAFGTSLSFDTTGNLAVGAPGANRAYVFNQEQSASGPYHLAFFQQLTDLPPNPEYASFGNSVAFTATDKLVVGAPGQNNFSGEVLSFELNPQKTEWVHMQAFENCGTYPAEFNLGGTLAPFGANVLVGTNSEESSTDVTLLLNPDEPQPCS